MLCLFLWKQLHVFMSLGVTAHVLDLCGSMKLFLYMST